MNRDFLHIIAATSEERRGLFLVTANRLGTTIQNIEKDFWVTWVLDLLFNGRNAGEPRLLFKGGTSLSKAYGLISRFSEDIDITVFREDIGHNIGVNHLKGLSGKKQRVHLESIKKACQNYINDSLKDYLNRQIKSVFSEAGLASVELPIMQDPDDPDRQTLLLRYPSVSVAYGDYIQPMVKIEAGAKSALDPHCFASIKPYIANDMPHLNLSISNVVTIHAERTFWDKMLILHGLRRWHDNRGVLGNQGHRVSRHYYDIYKLIHSPIGQEAITDHVLAHDCAHHAQVFFNSADLDLQYAIPGSLTVMPTLGMIEVLKRDYDAMAGMIFGEVPEFSDVLRAISNLEHKVNHESKEIVSV